MNKTNMKHHLRRFESQTTTPFARNLIGRPPWRRGFILVTFGLVWFSLSPQARGDCEQGCGVNGNTYLGDFALSHNTGSLNTAIGDSALFWNDTGSNNTATGYLALYNNTSGNSNTATGNEALHNNTTGLANTASGLQALYGNTTGNHNTAIGYAALTLNTTGSDNTATGYGALGLNTTGVDNTASGFDALYSNTTGNWNTASGFEALFFNTTGIQNTASGWGALGRNTTANNNTANGFNALAFNTTGHDDIAEGFQALYNNTTGSSNIALGSNAGLNLTTGSNNIDIGALGLAGESKTIRIGKPGVQTKTFIAGISGATVPTGVAVIVDANGHLGTTTSSARFKENIQPMDKTSEAILALKPVTFRYKKELDPAGIPQFGLVAEQVEKVNPALIARDAEGKPYSVRYEAVNAMLLNEFLKEHRKVEEEARINQTQEATIAQQQKEIKALVQAVKEQAAQIQKVSAQLEVSTRAQQKVVNSQ